MEHFISNYTAAHDDCKNGCLDHVTKRMYDDFQKDLYAQRFSRAEFDAKIKSKIVAKLTDRMVQSTKQQQTITFIEEFYNDESESKVNVTLCESCFVNVYNHIKHKTYANWKHDIKYLIINNKFQAEIVSSVNRKLERNLIMKSQFSNILDAKKLLGPLKLSYEKMQIACLPDNPGSLQAYSWMLNFFTLVGDSAPNREELVQIPSIYTKKSIYEIFLHQIQTINTGDEHETISLSQFKSIWIIVFPNVKITKFCQVCGKCATCHWIYERQETFKTEADLKDIKFLACVHKIQIVAEREVYMKKRDLAQKYPHLYFSIIIDGMAQDHCALPHYANKNNANLKMKQKINGAKQHGFSRSFYRSYPYLSGGTNLAIEVLLQEIERRLLHCEANNKIFPRHLFLQIDGGPENTSKSFYAVCEKLVNDGIFDHIEVSRLPVGHTHEDIDALFGVLWRAAQNKTFITPEDWKQMATDAFYQDYVDDDDYNDGKDDAKNFERDNNNFDDNEEDDDSGFGNSSDGENAEDEIEAICGDINCIDKLLRLDGYCVYCKCAMHSFCGKPNKIDLRDMAVEEGNDRICWKCERKGHSSNYINEECYI